MKIVLFFFLLLCSSPSFSASILEDHESSGSSQQDNCQHKPFLYFVESRGISAQYQAILNGNAQYGDDPVVLSRLKDAIWAFDHQSLLPRSE